MPCRNTYAFVNKNIESFSQVDPARSTSFAGTKTHSALCASTILQKTMSELEGAREGSEGLSTMGLSEHDGLSEQDKSELVR